MIVKVDKHFQSIFNRRDRLLNETQGEKIQRIVLERGLTHGPGKRKKKNKKKK